MWQKIKNYYHLVQALTAAIFFNFPSKKLIVIGVTGTDGKTTTVNMIYHILKSSGKKVSMISSVNAQIGPKTYDTGFHVTTPGPWQIQKYLRKAQDALSQYFVLEATSHSLDQNRLALVYFRAGVITNITHEHLDYHKTWENYANAKSKLLRNVQISVLNKDDKGSYNFLKNRTEGKIITYSLKNNSQVNLKNFPVKLKIPGDYNLSNSLAAAAVCSAFGIDKKTILGALANFQGVTGRLEEVNLGQDFKVIVDFAHTPNGLENALKALSSQLTVHGSQLIAVFGAAGLRDRAKRQLMGKVAAQFADLSVLTAEDPRTENVNDIIDEVAKGFTSKGKKEGKDFFKVANRGQAIEFAITKLAKKGDIVATFGKSHEKSMAYGKKETPWDEFEVTRKAIQRRLSSKRR
ncbi:MAG: UDP-N-acetylmuramoyl-L-alanyl-D-glutamate--2,6-diaminopimelate ligase [Patescibacteria group bacterium]